jgi:hypothetical protein
VFFPPHRTFLKRKGGLFKKAHELSVLCSVDVAVIIFGNNKKLYEYSSSDIGEILTKYQFVGVMCGVRDRMEADCGLVWRSKRAQRAGRLQWKGEDG